MPEPGTHTEDGVWRGARLVPTAVKLAGLDAADGLDEVSEVVTQLQAASNIREQIDVLRSCNASEVTTTQARAWARLLIRTLLHEESTPLKGALVRGLDQLREAKSAFVDVVVAAEVDRLVSRLAEPDPNTGADSIEGDGGVGPLLLLWELPRPLIAVAAKALATVRHVGRVLRLFAVLLGKVRNANEGGHAMVTEAKDATHLLKVLVSVLQRVTGRVAMTAHRDHDNGPAMREVRHGPFCPCLKGPVAET